MLLSSERDRKSSLKAHGMERKPLAALLVVLVGCLMLFVPSASLAQSAYNYWQDSVFNDLDLPNGANQTTIFELEIGSVVVGELIHVDATTILRNRGTSNAETLTLVRSTGTGQVHFAGTVDLEDRRSQPGGLDIQVWLHGIGRVTTSGTITLIMKISSAANLEVYYSSIAAYRWD